MKLLAINPILIHSHIIQSFNTRLFGCKQNHHHRNQNQNNTNHHHYHRRHNKDEGINLIGTHLF